MPGLLDGVIDSNKGRVEQRPDGVYFVVEFTADDFKRELEQRVDPRFRPFLRVVPTGNGFRVELKLS